MFAIYKREMRAYFTTPIGYIFMAIFLAASGLIFGLTTLQVQDADVGTYFTILIFANIVLVPLLTMKSFAEERRTRTEQLLLTSPVSLAGMVMAKFLSALTMYAGTLLLTAFYYVPLTMYLADNDFYDPNGPKFVGCMIAALLVGMSFIAIGVFVSSVTENQFAAACGTIGILVFLLVVSMLNSLIDSTFIRSILSWISVYSRYGNFSNGIFDFAAIVYYVSICAVFLFLTVRVFERRRWN